MTDAWLLILIAGVAIAIVLRNGLGAHRAKSYDEAQRDGWRERIAADPANCGAWEALGDSLRRAGRLDEARDAYLGALESGGDAGVLDTTRAKLRAVDDAIRTRARGGRAETRPSELTFCRACGFPNPPFRRSCESCGQTLSYASFADALRDPDVRRDTILYAAGMAGLGLLLHFGGLSGPAAIGFAFFGTVCAGAWRVLRP